MDGLDLHGRWWNGRFGRIARRDIWLKTDGDGHWKVEARQGDGDSRVWCHWHDTEAEARTEIAAMMDRSGGPAAWRDLIPIYGQDSPQLQARRNPTVPLTAPTTVESRARDPGTPQW